MYCFKKTNNMNECVAGLPPLSEGVAPALSPQQWIKDSTLWIYIYLMMEFILKDPALKNSVQGDIMY